MSGFDNRDRATYACDMRGHEGELMGPNGWGEVVAIDEVRYDEETNKSLVLFRNARTEDFHKWAEREGATLPGGERT